MPETRTKIVQDIDKIGKTRWNMFTEAVSETSLYNTYEWLKTLQTGEGMPARHAVVEKENTLIGALPSFISQMGNTPFYRLDSSRPGFGGPLLLHDRKQTLRDLLRAIENQITGKIIGHRIISNNLAHLKLGKILTQNGYQLQVNNLNVVFELSGTWNQVLGRMKKNRRYEIKRANSEEISEPPLTKDTLAKFTECYDLVLKRHNAKMLKPQFYTVLADQFKDKAKIFTAQLDEEMIGGYLLLLDEPRNTALALLGGIPEITKNSSYTNSLFKRMFEYTREQGLDYIEFGSVPTDIEDGLYQFKESFGGIDYPVYCWEKGNIIHKTLKTGAKFVKRKSN